MKNKFLMIALITTLGVSAIPMAAHATPNSPVTKVTGQKAKDLIYVLAMGGIPFKGKFLSPSVKKIGANGVHCDTYNPTHGIEANETPLAGMSPISCFHRVKSQNVALNESVALEKVMDGLASDYPNADWWQSDWGMGDGGFGNANIQCSVYLEKSVKDPARFECLLSAAKQ